MKAWNEVPEELLRKYWEVCGYKNIDYIHNVEGSINQSIVEFYRSRIVRIVESAGGPEAITSLDDPENDNDNPETKYPPEDTWNITTKS